MRKYLCVSSLCLNFIFILFFIGKRIYYAHSYKPPVNHEKELRARPIKLSDIVFVGNSLTDRFPLREMFPNIPVRNKGVSGNTSQDILNRIDSIADAKPRKIFLDVGINDILRNQSVDTLFINYKRIVETIKSKSPDTKIYIQSLLPVGKKHEVVQPTVIAFNKTLKEYSKKNSITFIDISPPFYTDGLLDNYYSKDDLHLNRSGYEIWRNEIAHYVY